MSFRNSRACVYSVYQARSLACVPPPYESQATCSCCWERLEVSRCNKLRPGQRLKTNQVLGNIIVTQPNTYSSVSLCKPIWIDTCPYTASYHTCRIYRPVHIGIPEMYQSVFPPDVYQSVYPTCISDRFVSTLYIGPVSVCFPSRYVSTLYIDLYQHSLF